MRKHKQPSSIMEKLNFSNSYHIMGLPHIDRNEPIRNFAMESSRIPKPSSHDIHTPTRSEYLEPNDKPEQNTEKQFDIIATKVNATIQDLNSIYRLIGYLETEIADKKNDIFDVIQDTVSQFAANLQREKSNIQNECEWLRQQIRIILAMINDTHGDKTLKLSSRGVVFDDDDMFQNGFKEDILHQMNNYHQTARGFYSSSPFNVGNDDLSMHQQHQYMVERSPQFSLLQLKARLNTIFLDVLRAFVGVYRKLNDLTLILWENIDTIGECWTSHSSIELIKSLPTKAEAETFSNLLDEFVDTTNALKLNDRTSKPDLMVGPKGDILNDYAFIVSSPRKTNKEPQSEPESEEISDEVHDAMENLRNINYKIVRSIRALRITKVTSEVVASVAKEVEWTETEMSRRRIAMVDVIDQCLSLIHQLSLSKNDIISIQKMRDLSGKEKSSENYFDVETLKFIGENPREFGLMDHHLEFVTSLATTLKSLKDAKQKKWDFYSNACVPLWAKLGESREYIQQFLDANSSLTDMSLANLKMELNRLYIKRAEFIDTFIADTRKEIKDYQDALLYSESQRQDFKYFEFDMNDFDDKELVLKEHENEVERLKAEYSTREPILNLYSQLKELLEDQNFLVELSKDSSRLLSKNSCKILLNEEKIRKRINKSLPRVIESLKLEVIKYNNEQLSEGKRPMSIDGQDFFERILLIESEQISQNNSKFRARNARDARSPRKTSVAATARTSPLKSRSPSKVGKEPRSHNSSGAVGRNASGTISPPNPTKRSYDGAGKSQAALKASRVGSNLGSSIFDSPPKSILSGSSTLSRLGGIHLQPLNSPLGPGSIYSDGGSDLRGDARSENSTLYSVCTRISPLRSDNHNNSIRANFSPIKGFDPVQMEGKENANDGFDTLSPIRVLQDGIHIADESSRLSLNSTMIGDDYQQWREDRIKAINNRM